MAYDPTAGEVFVSSHYTASIAVIADSNNSVVANFSVARGPGHVENSPSGMVYDSAKNELFVAEGNNPGIVSVISLSTYKVLANISVGQTSGPGQLAYDPAKGEIFISEYAGASVSVISDSSNQAIANISVISDPTALVYDSARGEIFVTNSGPDNVISVISDSTNKVISNITAVSSPEGAAYDSAKGEVFVPSSIQDSVTVISDGTNKALATVSLGNTNAFIAAYDSGRGGDLRGRRLKRLGDIRHHERGRRVGPRRVLGRFGRTPLRLGEGGDLRRELRLQHRLGNLGFADSPE